MLTILPQAVLLDELGQAVTSNVNMGEVGTVSQMSMLMNQSNEHVDEMS